MGVADFPGQPAVFNPNKWPISPKYALAIRRDNFLYSNHFSSPSPVDNKFMFISAHLLHNFTKQADCTFEKGIVYIMVSQLLVYFTDLRYHTETRGCAMDYCGNRADMVLGLRQKRLCPDCLSQINDEKFRKAIQAILSDEIIV